MKRTYSHLAGLSLILISSMFFGIRTYSQEIHFKELGSQSDWQSALEEATASRKDIFLDIYATWCGPCKMMDANVYTNATVYEYYNTNFVNLKVDGESSFGRILAEQYSLTAYPTMYFISASEAMIYQVVGYREPEALVASGTTVKESGKRYMELLGLFKSTNSLTPDQSVEFLNLSVKFEDKYHINLLAKDIAAFYTESDILNPDNKAIVMAVGGDIDSENVKWVIKNAANLKVAWGLNDFGQYLSEVFNVTMASAAETRDSLRMERIASEFIPVYMIDMPDRIAEAQLTTRKIYYAQTENWKNYVSSVEKHAEEFESLNPVFLYSEAYYVVENQLVNPFLLDKANEWVSAAILQSPNFESYFLAAIINAYRGDNESTLKWINLAENAAVSEDEKDSLEQLWIFLEDM